MHALAWNRFSIVFGLCACGVLFATSCKKPVRSAESQSRNLSSRLGAVEVLAQVEAGATNYVISYQQGLCVFSIFGDQIAMSIHHERESIAARVDWTNRSFLSTVMTRRKNDHDERLIDFNADGIADKKVVGSPPVPFLYFEGQFRRAVAKDQNYFIETDGESIQVSFDGSAWRPKTP